MPLREEFRQTGNWLFRWRSYLPLFIIFIILLGIVELKTYRFDLYWQLFCIGLALLGLLIRSFTAGYAQSGTSGTNTRKQQANYLNTSGIYSLVRHPLYVGNFFAWLGVALFFKQWWIAAIVALIFWIYYERIMYAEEEFLRDKYGQTYLDWASITPAFVPSFNNWKAPDRTLCLAKIIKNENKSLFAITVSFSTLDVLGHLLVEHEWAMSPFWMYVFFANLLIYLVIRFLKKKTGLLKVKERCAE